MVMLGRVIKGENNVPVARIMACVEVVMRVALCGTARFERSNRVHVQRLACGGTCIRLRDEPAEGDPPETELKGYIQADGILRAIRASDGIAFLPPWNERTSREWLDRWQAGGKGSMFISTAD